MSAALDQFDLLQALTLCADGRCGAEFALQDGWNGLCPRCSAMWDEHASHPAPGQVLPGGDCWFCW